MTELDLRRLEPADLRLLGDLDRRERVSYAYRLEDGEFRRQEVDWDIPDWFPGEGPHHVETHIDDMAPALAIGGILLGVFDGEEIAGLAIVVPAFEDRMAWLAFLHVSRPYRRRRVGAALWDEATGLARAAGSTSMYVSAITSGPAVDFYVRHGCRPIAEPHPVLLAKEPEDIHLICSL